MNTITKLDRQTVWQHIFAGFCASLVSIGLARFAYTPLIPPLIDAHWFSSADVVYLGAANLAGYLAGALLGRPIAARTSNANTLRGMMLLVTAAFFACALPLSVAWFFGWRFLSGVAGGAIMVLVAATVLPHIAADRKGMASGAIFLGIGLGIAGSGTLVPLLLHLGLRDTWIGLGLVSTMLTAASWFAWPLNPPAKAPAHAATHAAARAAASTASPSAMPLLYAEYALMAVGLVAPMVFFVDFIARGLGAGAHIGALFWVLYGLGAIIGPPLYGAMADKIGAAAGLRIVLVAQFVAMLCLSESNHLALVAVLAVVIGSFPPGIVPLVLARVHQLIPHSEPAQNAAWGRATTVFAALQALSGYAYSAIFNGNGGNHRVLFAISASAFAMALAADLIVPRLRRLRQPRRAQAAT